VSSYFAEFYETILKLVVGGLLVWEEGYYFDLFKQASTLSRFTN